MNTHANPGSVVVRFSSGLGNQLFQLTCGMAVASESGASVAADTTWFDFVARFHRPVRRFRLGALAVDVPEAFAFPRRAAIGVCAAAFDRWGRGRRLVERLGHMRVVHEVHAMADQPMPAALPGDRVYLNGYWQTARHFLSVRNSLLPNLRPRRAMSDGAVLWMDKIRRGTSVFLHVRRGDYAWTAGEQNLLPASYYHRAAEILKSHLGHEISWFVFAEDDEWARANLGFLPHLALVDYDSPDRDWEDMQLMAACGGGIIANSSFSWWGAALGDTPERLVIAPDRYWNREGADTRAWVLPGWRTIPAW